MNVKAVRAALVLPPSTTTASVSAEVAAPSAVRSAEATAFLKRAGRRGAVAVDIAIGVVICVVNVVDQGRITEWTAARMRTSTALSI